MKIGGLGIGGFPIGSGKTRSPRLVLTAIKLKERLKNPHTGDTESLDVCA